MATRTIRPLGTSADADRIVAAIAGGTVGQETWAALSPGDTLILKARKQADEPSGAVTSWGVVTSYDTQPVAIFWDVQDITVRGDVDGSNLPITDMKVLMIAVVRMRFENLKVAAGSFELEVAGLEFYTPCSAENCHFKEGLQPIFMRLSDADVYPNLGSNNFSNPYKTAVNGCVFENSYVGIHTNGSEITLSNNTFTTSETFGYYFAHIFQAGFSSDLNYCRNCQVIDNVFTNTARGWFTENPAGPGIWFDGGLINIRQASVGIVENFLVARNTFTAWPGVLPQDYSTYPLVYAAAGYRSPQGMSTAGSYMSNIDVVDNTVDWTANAAIPNYSVTSPYGDLKGSQASFLWARGFSGTTPGYSATIENIRSVSNTFKAVKPGWWINRLQRGTGSMIVHSEIIKNDYKATVCKGTDADPYWYDSATFVQNAFDTLVHDTGGYPGGSTHTGEVQVTTQSFPTTRVIGTSARTYIAHRGIGDTMSDLPKGDYAKAVANLPEQAGELTPDKFHGIKSKPVRA